MLRQCKALILLTTSTNSENFIDAQIVCMTIFRFKNSNLQFQLYCLTSIISAVLKLITQKDRKVSTTGMGIIVSLILLHFTIGKGDIHFNMHLEFPGKASCGHGKLRKHIKF